MSEIMLSGKRMVVLGASQGVGREIVCLAHAQGAQVLAIARRPEPLQELQNMLPGILTRSLDATDDDAPATVFDTFLPDVIVVCGGASPSMGPLQGQTWEQFSVNWNVDVKISFVFAKAALTYPLSKGACVVFVSSGAALAGSPLSGGYAGAKRMQMFLTDYAQKQSERLERGIRFLSLAPGRIMPETGLGQVAVAGYSSYLGISAQEFTQNIENGPTPVQVAEQILQFVREQPPEKEGNNFAVMASGVTAIP